MWYIRNDWLRNVKIVAGIDVHIAYPATCAVDSRGLRLDEGRRPAIVVRAMGRSVADSEQGGIDGRKPCTGALNVGASDEYVHPLLTRQFVNLRYRISARCNKAEWQLLVYRFQWYVRT
jgi:hypothetical protein